jgi:hypothetical protein
MELSQSADRFRLLQSSYYEQKARERDPDPFPERIKRDKALECDIQRVWEEKCAAASGLDGSSASPTFNRRSKNTDGKSASGG